MRLALLAPLPPEQTGIADYADHFREALGHAGVTISTPLLGQKPLKSLAEAKRWAAQHNWSEVDVVHAELGGGRDSEFFALSALAKMPNGPVLSATVHDPERLVWRPVHRWWSAIESSTAIPPLVKKALAVLSDPHTLFAERALARQLNGLVTLTSTGAQCLAKRMKLAAGKVHTIAHGTLVLPPADLPPIVPVSLLYFGFIYKGKGIEDLIAALGQVCLQHPELRHQFRLTIAGGTAPDMAYGNERSYLDDLRDLIAHVNLADHIDWVLDVPASDIAALVQNHHVMVLPYQESRKLSLLGQIRGTSGALAWAIAAGRGVITSNARAFAEEVEAGNGQSFPQGQVNALAQTLFNLLMAPEKTQYWAAQATVLSSGRQWPVTGKRFKAYFEQLIESSQGQRNGT